MIEQHHRGVLVYAGGDDVLAFLPVPEALVCAEELRVRFTDLMVAACFSLPSEHRPTLSVGVGLGHVMESMGDLLGRGRAAEREAKRDRNALAVLIDKRSGGRRSWRARWSDDPSRRLRESVELLQARLPARKVYEIASTLARLPKPHDVDGDAWARLTALEVRRSLARIEEGRLTPEDTGLVLDGHAGYADLHAGVSAWVDRLLLARTFAQAEPRRGHDKEEA